MKGKHAGGITVFAVLTLSLVTGCILALLERGAPSTTTEVPRLFILALAPIEFPSVDSDSVRMLRDWALESDGLEMETPGRRAITSFSEPDWMWSIA